MSLAEDQHAVQKLAAQGADQALADRVHARSLDGGAQDPGARGLEDGVERGGEVRSAVAEQEPDVLEPPVEGEVAGLLHCPLTGGVGGDATEVHPAGAMLDEHQDIEAFQQHGVHVQEVNREDPAGLAWRNCRHVGPAAWRWIDSRGVQDLPRSGRRDRHAEFRQLAVDATVSPQWVLLRQPNDQAGVARDRQRAARPALLARAVLCRRQFSVPGQ